MRTSKLGQALQYPSFWLAIFILASLIIGFNLYQDFGVSFDEPGIYNFAPVALDMYSTAFQPPERPVYLRESFLRRSGIPTDLFNYGPFYFIAVELFARSAHALGIQTPPWDLWHLAYFFTFEASIVIFYLLCRRWLSGWASLGATVLFASQPLLLGHAFMNPKDSPFMFFFMATVYSGLVMTDKVQIQPADTHHSLGDVSASFKNEWLATSTEAFAKFRRQLFLFAGALLLVVITHPLWANVLEQAVNTLYAAPANSPLGKILRVFSNNPQNIALEDFIAKGQTWLVRLEILIVLLMIAGIFWAAYQLLPKSGHQIGHIVFSPVHSILRSLGNPWILLAGVIFGLTLSIRLFAPLAAGLVLICLFWKIGWRAIYPSVAYTMIALITTYLTWPYLWDAPIKHLLKSWQVMTAFSIPGSWSSLPALLATQYTEPAVFLALAGMLISIVEFIRGKRSGLFFLFLGWALLPVAILILRQSFLYNNFRQVLFLIPPFFMIAGVAIEKIIELIRRPSLIVLFILLISLPGILAGVRLHPYQYVYYNQFVRSQGSEFHAYNGDYWGISLKEIADYINVTVPENSTVRVCGVADIYAPYLRSDIKVSYSCDPVSEGGTAQGYIVLSSLKNLDTIPYPQADVVYTVGRDNSVYAVVLFVAADSN